jgi:hypothetical protein
MTNKEVIVGNREQMMHVANSCVGYEPIHQGVESNIGTSSSKSCVNCKNLRDGLCVKDLFDSVLTSIDQT